jgi:cytochrome oxidase Cu insertion factor (SCO1/SenC/PrrC family)
VLRSRLVVYGAFLVVLLGLLGGAAWLLLGPRPGGQGAGAALIGGPFHLTDQHGATVTDQDFAGRWMLVYFGYTYCPDFCPLALSTMTQALDLLPAEDAEKIVPVFITIDPERDTVEQMASYAPLFHPRLVALTGTKEEIEQAASAYRVYYAKAEADDATSYLMDHSTFVYLMGPDGTYRTHFGHTTSPEEMAEALAAALASS